MDERQRLLDEISEYCDLRVRLATIPPSAKWRGMYFNAVSGVLERAGKLGECQRLMPETYSPLRMYPAGELLEHVAVAGALLRSPQDVHAGMHEVGRDNALYFACSLLGRTMLRLLDEDPYRVLQQGVAGRRQSATYVRWRLERTGGRRAPGSRIPRSRRARTLSAISAAVLPVIRSLMILLRDSRWDRTVLRLI